MWVIIGIVALACADALVLAILRYLSTMIGRKPTKADYRAMAQSLGPKIAGPRKLVDHSAPMRGAKVRRRNSPPRIKK